MGQNKKINAVGRLAVGVGLLAGLAAPQAARANILVRDEGEKVLVRTTVKGAHGGLVRVSRNSAIARQAFWFARLEAQRRERKRAREIGQARPSGLKGSR